MLPPLVYKNLNADDLTVIAQRLATRLRAGDTLLLAGEIGAGKTHFARALIQTLLNEPEDIPSPTFTLVQTYDTRSGEIWHADLYRLSAPEELEELGLSDAFDSAICLVEWPDRMGNILLRNAVTLTLTLAADGSDSRDLSVQATSAGSNSLLSRFADD